MTNRRRPARGRSQPPKRKQVGKVRKGAAFDDSLASPELYIGLMGALGADLDTLALSVAASLHDLSYRTEDVRLSRLIQETQPGWAPRAHADERYEDLMDAGDILRGKTRRKDVLAILAIQQIAKRRREITGSQYQPAARHAFIIQGIKTPEEVHTLREVYGGGFFLIGGYSSEAHRFKRLVGRIADSRRVTADKIVRSKARELLTRDEKDNTNEWGQNARGAFPLADLFVDLMVDREKVSVEVRRFFQLVHGHGYLTPRPQEYGMFLARGVALRSAELGRQVGAAICNEKGEVIALGANELPVAGGGLYWDGNGKDYRDWTKGEDTNDVAKRDAIVEALQQLREAGALCEEWSRLAPAELASSAFAALKGTRMMNLTEFGRAVHAEMAAITNAAMRGVAVENATLYTTTFPCHNCARHIIAAGIPRVVYIEPYPKSLAPQFHGYAIDVESSTATTGEPKVLFTPFVGVAPRMFIPLFAAGERKTKDTGKVIPFLPRSAVPRADFVPSLLPYTKREEVKARDLLLAYQAQGISLDEPFFQNRISHDLSAESTSRRSSRSGQAQELGDQDRRSRQ